VLKAIAGVLRSINDRSGHLAGDLLLQKVAERLLATSGPDAATCRLGGDEFIVIKGFREADDLHHFARRLLTSISEPYILDGFGRHTINTSIGVAEAGSVFDGQGLKLCILNADKALYAAKSEGKGTYRLALTT
jgi:diguanylate cyclase (GGDEF)-like protein